jgi:hypothetical protein
MGVLHGGPIQRLTAASGTGDVVGPASATDNAVARFDTTTGKLIQNSVVIIDDSGNTSGVGTLASGNQTITGTETITSSSATALTVGPNGATNPSIVVNANTASAVNGVSITGTASGTNPIIVPQGSDSILGLSFRTKNSFARTGFQNSDSNTVYIEMYNSTASTGSVLELSHSKNNTVGSLSNNASGDLIGRLTFANVIGSGRNAAAGIDGYTDGTPGSGDSPGRLELWTVLDGTTTRTTRLTIGNAGKFTFENTVTAGGTTGNQTIDKSSGTVNFAAAATSLTVTNALCTTSSIVLASVRTNDTTALIKNVVPGSGSFVINLNAAATAETSVGFLIIN